MDTAAARELLIDLVQPDSMPTLTDAEVDRLLLLARSADASGHAPYHAWSATTRYQAGVYRLPTVENGYAYTATVAGVSGATEPTWPTGTGGTVVDGGVTWQLAGAYLWTPTYGNLRAAAARGWRMKAAKVADQFGVAVGNGTRFDRDQVYRHCLEMARTFSSGGIGSLRVEGLHAAST